MNTNTATAMKTVADLIAHVVSECTPVDREERFNQMLDECYSFDSVGGPFSSMSPSEVLKECDPVAYRCGVNDWADGEDWIEIEGESYESYDVEKAREEFLDEMRSELADLEADLEALNEDDEIEIGAKVGTAEEIADREAQIAALEARIAELERYTF
jgi:hypothetical protein